MVLFTSFGTLQNELKQYYKKNGMRLQYTEAVTRLCEQGELTEHPTFAVPVDAMCKTEDFETFDKHVNSFEFPVELPLSLSEQVGEVGMFPSSKDVYVIRHPRYTRPFLHRHDYVEIDYVISGHCSLHFEDNVIKLEEGMLCMISPGSLHDIEITDESTVYCIMIRCSTIVTTFFQLLSEGDLLSLFFHKILQKNNEPNYLLMFSDNRRELQLIAANALQECYKQDYYSNRCCISFINILLASFARSETKPPYFFQYQQTSGYAPIINYIQNHYQTVTLSELSNEFHYSIPYLSTLIKQNAGISFSGLLRNIRITHAARYLVTTELQISEIAEIIGYNSADSFTRVFRSIYDCSPQEYRRLHHMSASR